MVNMSHQVRGLTNGTILSITFNCFNGRGVRFRIPGCLCLARASIITLVLAGLTGYLITGDQGAYFSQGDAWTWLSSGNANLRGTYWVPERDTLIAIPLFIFMGIMLQRSKIAEDLLLTMANLFGPVRGGLGVSVVFVGALLAAKLVSLVQLLLQWGLFLYRQCIGIIIHNL